jgi:hypothetical protein
MCSLATNWSRQQTFSAREAHKREPWSSVGQEHVQTDNGVFSSKENALRIKLNLDLVVVKNVRATAKCGYEIRRFGSHGQLASQLKDFHEISPFFRKNVEINQVSSKSDNNNRYFV